MGHPCTRAGQSFLVLRGDPYAVGQHQVGTQDTQRVQILHVASAWQVSQALALRAILRGELDNFSRVSGGFTYNVNSWQTLGVSAEATHRDPIGGGAAYSLFTAGPSYTWALGRDTTVAVGYTFRLGHDSEEGTAVGHQALVSLRYNFAVFP